MNQCFRLLRQFQVVRFFSLIMPHFPISFRFHISLLFLVNFFQDDTLGAAHKLLIITALAVFRVVKIPTLKMPKYLLLSGLRVALAEAVL